MKKAIILFATLAIVFSLNAQVQKKTRNAKDSVRINKTDKGKSRKSSKDTTKLDIRIDSVSNNQIDHKKL